MVSTNLLEVVDLSIEFELHRQGRLRVVDEVSFRVPPGRTVALVGESGSGKSVISQAIMGILPTPSRIAGGHIWFRDPSWDPDSNGDGRRLDLAAVAPNSSTYRNLRGGRMSMIFQEPMTSLSPLHTVGNQICEAVRLHHKATPAMAREQACEMLHRVGFPDPRKTLDTFSFELSGGLRQRAMIAMALVCRPVLLVADEPTTALDVTIQAQILELIMSLQSELGMAVMLITHDLGVVANVADEVVVIYHGKVTERGNLDHIYRHPGHPYLRALMRAVPRVGMPRAERLTSLREVGPRSPGPVATSAAGAGEGSPSASATPAPEDFTAQPLLTVESVSKSYRIRKSSWFTRNPAMDVQALCDVSFTINRGECLGLVGESGCGKTTLSKVIMRAIEPDHGSVYFHENGERTSVLGLEGEQLLKFRPKVQFIFQDPVGSLNPRMTVFDLVSEPLVIHRFGSRAERIERVKELMEQVGLDPRFLSRYPHSFSGGQRQRIGIARALALKPRLLLCDEPVSALDVSVQAQVLNLLRDLQREMNLTYLFISHNLAVVDYMADRIAVMCGGLLVELAPRHRLFKEPVHPYTQALLAAVPKPDPDLKLDLRSLLEGRVSDPRAWPTPFTSAEAEPLQLQNLGEGHFVRASRALLRAGA